MTTAHALAGDVAGCSCWSLLLLLRLAPSLRFALLLYNVKSVCFKYTESRSNALPAASRPDPHVPCPLLPEAVKQQLFFSFLVIVLHSSMTGRRNLYRSHLPNCKSLNIVLLSHTSNKWSWNMEKWRPQVGMVNML